MPYSVAALAFGTDGRTRPAKVFPNGRPVEYMTDDEIAVWEHVQHLERERERLATDVEMVQDVLDRTEQQRARLANECEEYRQVVQDGRRLPDPALSQDPALAAFTLGKLESDLKSAREQLAVASPQEEPGPLSVSEYVPDDSEPTSAEEPGTLEPEGKPKRKRNQSQRT